MKKFMHWTYIAIISVLAIVLWQTRSDLETMERQLAIATAPTEVESISPAEPAEGRDRRIYYLEALVDELQAENRALTLLLTQRAGNGNDQTTLASNDDAGFEDDDDYLEELTEQEAAPEVGEDSLPPTPRMMNLENLEQRFSDEDVDPDWAYASETSLQDIFLTVEGLRYFQLDSADCRATMCRLMVTPLEDDRAFNMRLLSSEVRNLDMFGDEVMMMVLERADESQLQIFIDRSGN
ncbi:hypothetical protein [Aliidiomarina indica]|uniref:hypothetical protein n=1 Tax=Aliidiomarina indica TaxID=2749147 RepID=UPI00188DD02E|nr:hypothetical protein [Aliidiomarina indica]